ncbi:hypothetical protein DA102_033995 [Sinorhizobium meliloti]|nr:hypothetical protein DA102_033995 [Sinorhizobium meliloti]
MILLPLLLRQFPSSTKIAVIAADSTYLSEAMLDIGDPTARARVIIGGIEGGTLWQNEMKRPAVWTDVADVEADVSACVARLRSDHPSIAAILFECTMFPLVAPQIRRATGLPVFDITTLCQLAWASVA